MRVRRLVGRRAGLGARTGLRAPLISLRSMAAPARVSPHSGLTRPNPPSSTAPPRRRPRSLLRCPLPSVAREESSVAHRRSSGVSTARGRFAGTVLALVSVAACGSARRVSAPSTAVTIATLNEAASAAAPAPADEDRPSGGTGAMFRSEAHAIAFAPGPFATVEHAEYVELDGGFWVDEPHGLVEPGQDSRQYFRGRLAIVSRSVRESVKDASPYLESVLWRTGAFVPSEASPSRVSSVGGPAS